MNRILDVREEILRHVRAKQVTASIITDDEGIIAGTPAAMKECDKLGLSVLMMLEAGAPVKKGDEVIRFVGTPKQVVIAEELLIGLLAKPSGIATSADRFVRATQGKPRVVCGAWKKMPPSLKDMVREAVVVGGAIYRMETGPFVYLDKNYVELLGGIKPSLAAARGLNDHFKVVQIKGRYGDIMSEAHEAVEAGADIVFIDTANLDDVRLVAESLRRVGLRSRVKLAFGGGVNLETIANLKALDIDIIDIGREIVDAPILDMRLEIVNIETEP